MILLTGLPGSEIDLLAQESGAADYLSKISLSAELVDRSIRYAVQNSERLTLLNSILRHASSGMIAVDHEMQPIVWNLQALEAFGIYRRFNWVKRDEVAVALNELIQNGDLPDQFHSPQGLTFDIQVQSVDGVGKVITLVDVSRRSQTETSLRNTATEAEKAYQIRTNFLTQMSHEIRTPLHGIIGMTQVLEFGELDDKQRRSLNTIRECGNGLIELVNNILDLSKLDAGEMKAEVVDFDISCAVDTVTNLLAPLANRKSLELTAFVDPRLWGIQKGDKNRVVQVLTNLLGNAIKFTEKGGICVSVSKVFDGRSESIFFEVTDSGPGIDASAQEKLFRRFKQIDSVQSDMQAGSGLGLSLCKELVELMKGQIGCDSEPGKGSRFWFSIPISNQTAALDQLNLRRQKFPGSPYFLVISPEYIVGNTMERYIKALGGQVVSVASLEDAEDHLHNNNFDHIVIDDKSNFPHLERLIRETQTGSRESDKLVIELLQADEDYTARSEQSPLQLLRPLNQSMIKRMRDGIVGGLINSEAATTYRATPEARQRLKVMLVDDNVPNQRIGKLMLEHAGFDVDVVTNGYDAIQMASETRHDAVLLDICMPKIDGIQTAQEIRKLESGSTIPIITLTADVNERTKTACAEVGVDAFLTKPVNWSSLIDLLNQIGSHSGQIASSNCGEHPLVLTDI